MKLELDQQIPPVPVPPDTAWVKRIKIQSKLLTEFWGQPFHLGATVLLPKGYDQHPEQRYPVIYFRDTSDLARRLVLPTVLRRRKAKQIVATFPGSGCRTIFRA